MPTFVRGKFRRIRRHWFPATRAAGTDIIGNLDLTLDPLTVVATGTVEIAGVVAKTLDALTAVSDSDLEVRGDTTKTLAALTLVSTGTVAIAGVVNTTLAPLTSVATGTVAITGTLTKTLDALTSVATSTIGAAGVTPKSWEEHFSLRGWTSIKNQTDATYPLYVQPTELTGSYEEVIDYGTVISSIIVTILYNLTQLAGTTTVVIKMAVSDDDITYTSFVAGASQFYASFRYLKFRLEFTGVDDHAVALVWNINTILAVKRENDGGEVEALSTDLTGTEVFFNKPFKDIESITLTVKETTTAYVAIYDFVDVPNPTSFTVYVYTLGGARATKTVSWKARGII